MVVHTEIEKKQLLQKIKNGELQFAGNHNLKIYGTLKCKSGKRMKKQNRVFFSSVKEAKMNGFRPCGHCLRTAYKKWKNELV